MEWGSVSDWVSSLSTLGTLGVAFAAFKKAPEWMAQKQYDSAHKIIDDAIYRDIPKVGHCIFQYYLQFIQECNNLNMVLDKKFDYNDIEEKMSFNIYEKYNQFNTLNKSTIDILKSVSRYGYELTDYALNIIKGLENYSSKIHKIQGDFETTRSDIQDYIHVDTQVKRSKKKEIDKIIREVTIIFNDSYNFTSSIVRENRRITDFIIKCN
ncbi:hypothetical protein F3J34_11445 [Klebsiella sp. Ap-873]|nr:hypothetical protein [Klebsiella sp. Ap-873]